MDNPCLHCGFYDPDMGCECSPLDRSYACPLFDSHNSQAEHSQPEKGVSGNATEREE